MKQVSPFKLLVLVLLAVLSLRLAAPALAHTELVSASPPAGAVASPGLSEIRLTFNEDLFPGSTFELLTDGFQSVPGLVPQVEGSTVWATLTSPLAAGPYTVQWTAIGADGHAVEGSYPFSVSAEVQGDSTPWLLIGLIGLAGVGVGAVGYGLYRRRRKA